MSGLTDPALQGPEQSTKPFFIPKPKVIELPISPTSQPTILEPYHVDLLPVYGYTTREYLISSEACGKLYCTRLLLRCPEDTTKFSGLVLCETSHIWSGTSIWRATNRWLMRNGHAWLEIDSQAPVALGTVKLSNPERYSAIDFPPGGPLAKDFKDTIPFIPNPTRQLLEDEYSRFMLRWWDATPQSPYILAAASYALRSGTMMVKANNVFIAGLSQTGGVVRRYITHSSHLRLPDGSTPFEALLPCASGGVALPESVSHAHEGREGPKVIEILGESEFQSVRWACGVSGQVRGLSHRRPDSSTFRLYEVAGMGHRESRYMSQSDITRYKDCILPQGWRWSQFPNSFVYAAIFESCLEWVTKGIEPPSGRVLENIGDTDELVRDEHGNAKGGVRGLYVEVPTSRLVAATPEGRPSWYCGSEGPFDLEKMRKLYGTVAEYRRQAGAEINLQIEDGFLLQSDAEVLRRETVEQVAF